MNRQEILELTGAEEWSWIVQAFGTLGSVEAIEKRMLDWFDWDNTTELAQAIHDELN